MSSALILVVDDHPADVLLLRYAFEEEPGWRIEMAAARFRKFYEAALRLEPEVLPQIKHAPVPGPIGDRRCL